VNIIEIADKIAETHRLPHHVAKVLVNKILKMIATAAINGEEVKLPGFGQFKVKDVPPRTRRNAATGEAVDLPASKKLVYLPAKKIRNLANGIEPPPRENKPQKKGPGGQKK